MIKGVTEKEEQIIKSILQKYPYEFYYYGSRVKGNFSIGSDLDILLKSDKLVSLLELEKISTEFNESRIPYIVNISLFQNMDKNFYDLIKSSLVKI
jgi:predicted nucleotidyltransferase